MNHMKHSLGPWKAQRKQNSGYSEVMGQRDACIAEVFNHSPGSLENARLMAAAPEMLEALEFIEQWIDEGANHVSLSALFNDDTETLAEAINRILQKAREG